MKTETLKDVVLITCARIPENEKVKSLYYYDIRHSDECGMEPITLKKSILVNHFGTLVSSKPIDFGKNNCIELTEEDKEVILSTII